MVDWFVGLDGQPFMTFGVSHIIMLIIYFLGLILFLTARHKLRRNAKLYNIIRWGLFGVLVLSEITYQIWAAVNEIWSLSEHIPLHLCGITGITGAIALFSHNEKLIHITFFFGLVPAFLAVVTPELPYDIPHFRYWKFFIHHIVVSWVSLFLVVANSTKITFKSMLESYGYILLYAALIGFVVNPVLGSNYLYLSHTPTASTPLDLLGSGFIYYFNLCLLALSVFFVQYIAYNFSLGLNKHPGSFGCLSRYEYINATTHTITITGNDT
ncbi:TIGR02206 family membrane protein [Virgibacillus ihumii]|uniref:YwaF family protein n=1 Tax=Virgibacillus ihumii TaxID=2686091 RepID=UPI00157DCB4F|nr:TIGR02206 family membrane protein [Virgibacillus ihumii]